MQLSSVRSSVDTTELPQETPTQAPTQPVTKAPNAANESKEALPLNEGFAFPVTRQLMRILGSYTPPKEAKAQSAEEKSQGRGGDGGYAPTYKETRQRLVSEAPEVVGSIMKFVQGFVSANAGSIDGGDGTIRELVPNGDVDVDNPFDPDTYIPGTDNKDGEAVNSFLRELEGRLRGLGYAGKCSAAEWSSTTEALERLVMLKLHPKVFRSDLRDQQLDAALSRRIQSLAFITPTHLDIRVYIQSNDKALMEAGWSKAADELNKMNLFKTPKDKVICVVNCCRRVTRLLLDGLNSGNLDGQFKQPGADDLLPSLIYAVLRANPAHLHSNIEFIASFRNPSRLTSETRYFFTFLTSAVAWIHQVDHTYLSGISEKEFLDSLQRCGDMTTEEEKEESSVEPDGEQGSGSETPMSSQCDSEEVHEILDTQCSPVLQKSLGNIPIDKEGYEVWRKKHLRFRTRTTESLTIAEVSQLLEEYQYLASLIDDHVGTGSA